MSDFKRKIGAERTLLMLPLNVVVAARVRGPLDADRFETALETLKVRHRFLGVRVIFDQEGTGYYVDDDVPDCPVSIEERRSNDQWLDLVAGETRASFPIETGPLFRCTILRSAEVSEILLAGHHGICDGRSLGYLLRDLLTAVTEPDASIEALPAPPPIDETTVPEPAKPSALVGWVTKLINKKWAAQGKRFGEADMLRMHGKYWQENDRVRLVAWELERDETEALVSRCREEGGTVNAAVWAAFLAAQHEVQPERKRHQRRSALAVSTRDMLNAPVGEQLGFYGPSFFSDVEEKVVGVMTVGGKLSVILACNEAVTGPGVAEKIKVAAKQQLDWGKGVNR